MNGARRMLLRWMSRKARPYLRALGLLQTAKIFNQSAVVWEPGNESVVVLSPHMDDETIGCGGALAAHAARGSRITVIYLTDCCKGGRTAVPETTASFSTSALTTVRKEEARRALGILGISDVMFLGGADGSLAASPALVNELRAALLQTRPSLIYLPSFLEEHPDHRVVSELLAAASEDLPPQTQCMAFEVWTPLFPNCFVNIDAYVDIKRRAIAQYASQLLDADYLHSTMGLNAYRSSALFGKSCHFAEAFLSLALPDYKELYAAYRQGSRPGPVPVVKAVAPIGAPVHNRAANLEPVPRLN